METLKVLILEDNNNDLELVKYEVESSRAFDFQFRWVLTKDDFSRELRDFYPDIILSDYKLPQFTGLDALKVTRDFDPTIPFIIVTGTLSEEAAADSIKAGAWDYVVKERLHRLPSALQNAIKLRREKLKTRKAELELSLIKEKTGIQLKLLYDAINNAPSSVVITDNNGKILYVNPRFHEVTGYRPEEVVGQNPRILKSGKHDSSFYKCLWDTILSGHTWKGEIINRKKNGELYWEQDSISPIQDENGDILHFVAIKHDITEQKDNEERLRNSEEKFRLISTSAQDGIIMIDKKGMITYWNPGAEKIFGYTAEEVSAANLHQLLAPGKYHQRYAEGFARFLKTGTGTVVGNITELDARKKDGSIIQIELSLAGMRQGNSFGAVGIVRDITDRKAAEKELIRAKEKAEESDRLKSAFLATMSHELRTPLNAIIGFSGLIDESLTVSEIVDMGRRINSSGHNLLKIIESMFEISMLEARVNEPSVEEFPVLEVFGPLKTFLSKELSKQSKSGVQTFFHPDKNSTDIVISTDKTKLSILLTNLLSNAVKFTAEGQIDYGFLVDGSGITFFVKDTGIGIPEEKMEIIYQKFRQVDDSYTRQYGGVGLGLSICREIAVLLKGILWAESVRGAGSTFYFKLENVVKEVAANEYVMKEKVVIRDLSGKTIIIVDDEPDNLEYLNTLLKKTRANIRFATNGKEAVSICENDPGIDLVLMDIKMPGLSGDEATAMIKRKRPNLPVIAQTAYATEAEVRKYTACGFDSYVTKPILRDQLLMAIYKYLII